MKAFRKAGFFLLLLLAARPAGAVDPYPPSISNLAVTDCEGTLQYTNPATTTGTPNIGVTLIDTAPVTSPVSGLRFGIAPHSGGTTAMPGTVLLLHLNADVSDDSGLGQTVTNPGTGVTLTADRVNGDAAFGNSGYWDGTNADQLDVAASASLASTTNSFTIQAWIKPSNVSRHPILVFNSGAPGADNLPGIEFWMGRPNNNGELYVNLVTTPTYTSHEFSSQAGVVTAGVWQLVTVTFDFRTRVVTFYRNDVMKASATLAAVTDYLAVNFPAYVGYRPVTAETFFGSMDEVRVVNNVDINHPDINVMADYYSGRFQYFSDAGTWTEFPSTKLQPANYNPYNGGGTLAATDMTVSHVPLLSSRPLRMIFQDMAGNTAYSPLGEMVVSIGPPTSPDNLRGTPLSNAGIRWTWDKPSRLCLTDVNTSDPGHYKVIDQSDGTTKLQDATGRTFDEAVTGANTLFSRRVQASDAFGYSPLSDSASAYTYANPPTLISTSSIGTSSITVTWNPNGNPVAYTRYEVSLWDAGFANQLSVPVAFSDNRTARSADLLGLSPGTVYYIRVRARNGSGSDNYGGTQDTGYTESSIPTFPAGPPAPVPTPTGTSTIAWSWPAVANALSYDLESDTGGYLARTAATSFTSSGLSPNQRYSARLRVRNLTGYGEYSVYNSTYTDARAPTNTRITFVSSGSLSLAWDNPSAPGAPGNPDPTTYEVQLASHSGFTGSVNSKTTSKLFASFYSLLAGNTYCVQARAIGYNNRTSAFAPYACATTPVVGPITSTQSVSSAYVPIAETVGLWHFDSSTGTVASDSSPYANDGNLAYLTPGTSTPTWTGGVPGLGGALNFASGRVSVPHANTALDLTGSVSVEAWVKPTVASQLDKATVLCKGLLGSEPYALEVYVDGAHQRYWRFTARRNGTTTISATSTQTVVAGQWVHLIGVYDAAAPGSVRLYVDGVRSDSRTANFTSLEADADELTIGARGTGGGAYGYNFNGLIDEVHVVSKALSDAEAAAERRMTLPSTVGSTGYIPAQITLPPDAFGGRATLLFSSDPLANGIVIPASSLSQGLNQPPTGMTLVPNTLIEIVASKDSFVYGGTLGSSATISLPYADADDNTLVDGTDPPISAQLLRMYTLDPTVIRWVQLPSSVDLAAKRVSGLTSHFSIFALFGVSGVQANTQEAYVYPVPWKPGAGGSFDSAFYAGRTGLAIANLPASGTVRIFTLSGEEVVELPFEPRDLGTIIWDGKNHAGREVASGVYFAYVKGAGNSNKVLKFAIER